MHATKRVRKCRIFCSECGIGGTLPRELLQWLKMVLLMQLGGHVFPCAVKKQVHSRCLCPKVEETAVRRTRHLRSTPQQKLFNPRQNKELRGNIFAQNHIFLHNTNKRELRCSLLYGKPLQYPLERGVPVIIISFGPSNSFLLSLLLNLTSAMTTIKENQSLYLSSDLPSTGNKMKKLELVALEALTDLAHPSVIAPEKDHFPCPLELTLQPSFTEDYVAAVQKHGEKGCNNMVAQPIEAEKHFDFHSNSDGREPCASYVGTSSSKDKNMLIEENHVVAVQQHDGKECDMMMMKPLQAEENTKSQPDPTSRMTCASYVGTNLSTDLNIVAQDYAVVVPQHGIKEGNVMMPQPTQAEEHTKVQPNPNGKKASVSYVGIISSTDYNMVPEHYPVVCQHGEKASNMMMTKPKQVAENTGFQPYISGSRPCAPYLGNKLKRNLSMIPEEHEVVFPKHGEKECNMMMKRPMFTRDNTEFQSNPSGSKSFVPYVATKSKPDISKVHEDHMIVFQRHPKKECNPMAKPTQAEKITKSQLKPSGSKTCANVGAKSRRDLKKIPEAEKEERRVRRLLANRESARQTILRRQARIEELTRKTAVLRWENDNLKKEKEVAMKKYDSAKRINESLKSKLGLKIVKIEDEDFDETQEDFKLNSAHKPSTSTNTYPLNISNRPSSFPCVLPSTTPGSNSGQSAPQNGIDVPSQFPVFTYVMSYSVPQHENPSGISVSGNPSYTLTFPWPIPVLHTANGIYPQPLNLPDEINVVNQSKSSSSLKAIPDSEKHHVFPTRNWIGESSTSSRPAIQVEHKKMSWIMLASDPKVISAGTTNQPNGNQGSVGPSKRQMNDINDAEAKKKMKLAASNSSPSATNSSQAATNSNSSQENEENERSMIRRQIIALTTAEARKWRKHVLRSKKLSVRQVRKTSN